MSDSMVFVGINVAVALALFSGVMVYVERHRR
jgi:hypothetical protein